MEPDIQEIIACINSEWLQVISLFIANTFLLLWCRSEIRIDMRHRDKEMKEFKQMMLDLNRDHHGRICTIEEKNRK